MRVWLNETLAGTRLQKCASLTLGFMLFIAPLKFGNSVSSHVYSFFPITVLDVLKEPWPVSWVPPVCGLALILVGAANHRRLRLKSAWPIWAPILLALVACVPGWIFAVNSFQPFAFTLHIAGWLAFSLALLVHVQACPKSRNLLYAGLFAGIMILCLQTLLEYFIILPINLEMVQERVRLYGAESVPARMITLLKENRPQAYFVITNSLAAHFILVIPVLVALGIRWGARIDPPETSKRILPIILVTVPAFCLFTTKSRAAMLAFCLGCAVAALAFVMSSAKIRKRYGRIVMISLGLFPLVMVGVYLALKSGRTMSSMWMRFTYWEYAWKMFAEKPWTGCGIGEFFYNYLRLKPASAEITRLPHSMFFLFLSNCGILGGLAAMAVVLSPVVVWNQVRRGRITLESKPAYYLGLAGVAAWIFHAQADFNVHVPATVLTMTALVILPLSFDSSTDESDGRSTNRLPLMGLLMLAAGCLLGLVRSPGDYHMAVLEARIQQRDEALAEGKFVGALEGLVPFAEKASAGMRGCPISWEKVGVSAMREKRMTLAVTAYGHVTRINPRYAAGHYRLAVALLATGDIDNARKEFLLGKAWNPNNAEYKRIEQKLFP